MEFVMQESLLPAHLHKGRVDRELVEGKGHIAKPDNTFNNYLLPFHVRTGLPFVMVVA